MASSPRRGGKRRPKEPFLKIHKAAVLLLVALSYGYSSEPPGAASGKIIISDGPPPAAAALSATTTSVPTPASSNNAAHPFAPFVIYSDQNPRKTTYVPSGYMGDSDLTMSGAYIETPHGKGACLRVNYKAKGPKGWTGLYWQNPANNWGDVSGRAGYDLRGATKLTFWARGEEGGERVHEFRMGGIVGQYPDSDVANLTNVRLTKEWKQYTIDLSKKDLRHIIGGFGLFMNKFENTGGAVIYIDDILFEGPQAVATGSSSSAPIGQPSVQFPAPATKPVPVAVPAAPVAATHEDLVIKEEEKGLKVSFSSRLMFESGKAVLVPSSAKVLDQLIALLTAYPKNRVLIEGHTDNTGDNNFNLHLSELRAKAVQDYLLKHGGYEESRFKVIGYGDTKPIADNATKAGRSLNRRVEVTILKEAKP